MMASPRDVDRILHKLDKQDDVLTELQTTAALLVRGAADAAQSRERIFQKTEQIETQVRHVEARVGDVEFHVDAVRKTVAEVGERVGLIETWREGQDRREAADLGERRGLDRIRGKVWAAISGLTMLAGGALAALAIEIAKRWL